VRHLVAFFARRAFKDSRRGLDISVGSDIRCGTEFQGFRMSIETVTFTPMTKERAAPVLRRLELAQFLAEGTHLPELFRDYGGQEKVFQAMHDVTCLNDGDGVAAEVTWVQGQSYVIDHFLRFMACHGYMLVKSDMPLHFEDMQATVEGFEERERQRCRPWMNPNPLL
jgi:hypothetical protein